MTVLSEAPTPPPEDSSADQGYGGCSVVLDNSRRGREVVCGEPAIAEVLVRNDFGHFVVGLCRDHKTEHRDFYRDRNKRRPRRHN